MNGNLQTEFDPWFEDPNFADSYAMRAFAQSTSGASKRRCETTRKAIAIDTRNENHRFNLANIYLANREPDQALAPLQSLEQTVKAEMASQVARAIQSIREFQQFRCLRCRPNPPGRDGRFSKFRRGSNRLFCTQDSGPSGVLQSFFGTIAAVDCSAEPSATLTVASGSKTSKLNIADKHHLILSAPERSPVPGRTRK